VAVGASYGKAEAAQAIQNFLLDDYLNDLACIGTLRAV
jgi:hypothetical protein